MKITLTFFITLLSFSSLWANTSSSCMPSIDLVIDSTRMVTLNANDFTIEEALFAAYTPPFRVSFSPQPTDSIRTFTCANEGESRLDIWIIDADDIMVNCRAIVNIERAEAFVCSLNWSVDEGSCFKQTVTRLDPSGLVRLTASHFQLKEDFLATLKTPIQISYTSDINDTIEVFTCDQAGLTSITLWITDADGAQRSCDTYLLINTTYEERCGDGPSANSCFKNELEQDILNVITVVEDPLTERTYNAIRENCETYGIPLDSVIIRPQKNINSTNGVTTFDLVLIRQHILGRARLDSPYKMIAADANQSHTISTLDMIHIRKLILGIDDNYRNNSSWRFVDANYEFPNPENPWLETFPEAVYIKVEGWNAYAADFTAIKVGDVNNSANPAFFTSIDERNDKEVLNIYTSNTQTSENELVTIDFTTDNIDLLAYQFTLQFDPTALAFVEVNSTLALAEHFNLQQVEKGIITVSWDGELLEDTPLFSLKMKAKKEVHLQEVLSINSEVTLAEAYEEKTVLGLNLKLLAPNSTNETSLYQNTPNPFKGQTAIGFYLAQAGTATLTIQDVTGHILKVTKKNYEAGQHQVALDLNTNPQLLFYTLETAYFRQTRRMLLVK